jgi:hypothetical protein
VDGVIRAAATIGRTARSVLVLATVLGLALMHTLGHTGGRLDDRPGVAGVTVQAAADGLPMLLGAAAPCPDGHCDGHGGSGPSGAWSTCLAFLTGLAVLALLIILLAAAMRRTVQPAGVSRVVTPRAPPDDPTGRTLASTAVLRI